ncbi:MAG: T4 RnlA family RNA ligase [Bacteroidota bacterium]
MNKQLLEEMIQRNYVKVQKHPTHDLFIYNYTASAQYERFWNDCTLACRGLILDGSGKVIARPFPKFFNLGEIENQPIPNESFEVFEKMDGSLGILYWIGGKPFIATRGSFVSEQSVIATKMLKTFYSESIPKLEKGLTYLFEIIYPENRIVVDYGNQEALVLIGVIDNASGQEMTLPEIGFPIVPKFDGLNNIHQLKAEETFNKEGFVIKFKSGYRLKVKFDEYQRVHRIVTNVSSITIWEYLKEGKSFEDILERVPDEFFNWVRNKKKVLIGEYNTILAKAKADFKILNSRKETALYFQTCQYPAVMFNLLDGKPIEQTIWKMVRPTFEKPFAQEEEI